MDPNRHYATLLVLRSQALFAAVGVLVKILGHDLSSLLISAWLMILGTLVAFINCAYRRELSFIRRINIPVSIARSLLVIANIFLGFYGYSSLPLSEAFMLSFLTPLFLTVLSKFFLGEQVGWRRGIATLVGFSGVIVMLYPGLNMQSIADGKRLLPELAMIGCAFFNAINLAVLRHRLRFEVPSANLLVTSFWAMLLVVAYCYHPLVLTPLSPNMISGLLMLAVVASTAVISNSEAYHRAEASYLAPFGYIQLFWATLAAWIIWGEWPSVHAWAGAALIIGSGIYTVHRERYWAKRRQLVI